jgi:hypothetical protein
MEKITRFMLKISCIVIIFSVGSGIANAQKRISITDFGSKPDDGRNVISAVRNALKACEGQDSCILIFPKGRYDFWPDFTSNRNTVGIQMDGLKNVVLDGNGSEFIFHGKMQIASLINCDRIKMMNFIVDWEIPLIAQGTYVEATDDHVDLKMDPRVYSVENDVFYLVGEGWKSSPTGYFTMYDKIKKEILYKTHDGDNRDVFSGKAEELEPGLVRFYGKPKVKPEPGTYQSLYAGTYIVTGISISECKDTYLKDITIYHSLSNGVYGYRSENITMDNVSLTVNEKKGRVFSGVADASHFTNCKGLIRVINCKHEGQGDDFINVRGANSMIAEINDEFTLTTGGRNSSTCAAGDEIWFIYKETSQRGEVRTIKAVERVTGPDRRSPGSKVTFTQPIPKNVKMGDFLENKTWNPSVEIRNCEIRKKNRARGILVTTPEKVVIENNYFRTAGTAILIEGDTEYWFESGAHNDLTIRNNVFEDVLTSGCAIGGRWEWGEAIITITPSHRPQDEKSIPYHKNIKIENNIFKTFDIPLVHARSVDRLSFTNNEIIRTYTYEPYAWLNSSFRLNGCRNVVIDGNTIDKNYSTRTILFENMKNSDVKVGRSQGFKMIQLTKENDSRPVW